MTQGIQCPICRSNRVQEVVALEHHTIKSCLVCTNAWTYPPPNAIDYEAENFHQFASGSPEKHGRLTLETLPSQWQRSVKMQTELLRKSLKPGARILEIGCGEGILLEQLKLQGFDVVGIEPSADASAKARSIGLNVITGYFPDTTIEGIVSAVIMTHVLEHLANPLEILEQLGKVAPNGKLLLVQTNWQGLIPKLRGAGWYAWIPNQHYWHFTPKGLNTLISKLNWQVEYLEYSSLVHHRMRWISNIASRINGWGDQFHFLANMQAN